MMSGLRDTKRLLAMGRSRSRPEWVDCVEKLRWWLGRADFAVIAKTRNEQYQ